MSKSKIQLLLLHGALGSSSSFQHLMPYLEDQYDLIIPNFPGHAGTPVSGEPYSVEYLSDFLRDFLRPFNEKEIFVFGYSLGGYVALLHESRFPGSFSRIITLATKIDWNSLFAEQQRNSLNPDYLKSNVPEFYEKLKKIHEPFTDQLLLDIIRLMESLGEGPAVNKSLMQEIEIPILLSVGELDKMVSVDETKNCASMGKFASFLKLENTSHPIEKLRPEALLSLLDFFES